MLWRQFFAVDLAQPWDVDFWRLVGEAHILTHRVQPWALQVARLAHPLGLWSLAPTGPPVALALCDGEGDDALGAT